MLPEEIEINGYYVSESDPADQVRVVNVTPNATATRASVKTESRWDGGDVRIFESENFARAYRPL